MHVSMQDIGADITQLSECRYALMLGVQTPENRLEDFLNFARAILNINNSVLIFENEPYAWHCSPHGLGVLMKKTLGYSDFYFKEKQIFKKNNKFFQVFSEAMHNVNATCHRLIGFQLKYKHQTLGQLFLYDDCDDEIRKDRIALVENLIENLVHTLRTYIDNARLYEEYEQQVALNFSKNKYLQILSHDLRAPFHGLLGFTDVLLNESQDLTQNQCQDIVHYLSDTLNSTYNLLESVLKWSMADGGRFIYHPINFKLKEASSIVVTVLDGLAKKKNIEIIDEISEDIEVYADIHMITSVIQNLVSNALKFCLPNKKCKVIMSAKVIDKHVYISVQDDGLGMSALQVDHLFEPDIKASVVGTSGEIGAGLGLMLCKRFVELNLGAITVVSEQNIGSTFTVRLPISLAHIDPNDNLIVFINKP